MEYNPQFWQALDQLLARSALVIDRPKDSSHPRFPEMVYPLDYGYLENTASMDEMCIRDRATTVARSFKISSQ